MPLPDLSRNERLILQHLRRHGPTPRSGLGPAAGISAQAVTNISRRLIEAGLLRESDVVRGKVGQPSTPLSLDPDGALFLGLKIGRRLAELALVDFSGQLRALHQEIQPHPDPDRIIAFARRAIAATLAELPGRLRARIAGLGIAAPFRLWDWGSAFAAWRGRDLQAELAAGLPFPVLLENDASAACGAELIFGSQQLPGDFAYFYVGHYAGGGLVLDGRLRLGPQRNAGALGSMPAPGGGQLLERASVATLERMLGHALRPSDAAWDVPAPVEAEWCRAAGEAIGFAALSAAAVCDLPAVVIDGAVPPRTRAALVQETAAAMSLLPAAGLDRPVLRQGSLGRHARVLGAAALPLSQRFLPDGNNGGNSGGNGG